MYSKFPSLNSLYPLRRYLQTHSIIQVWFFLLLLINLIRTVSLQICALENILSSKRYFSLQNSSTSNTPRFLSKNFWVFCYIWAISQQENSLSGTRQFLAFRSYSFWQHFAQFFHHVSFLCGCRELGNLSKICRICKHVIFHRQNSWQSSWQMRLCFPSKKILKWTKLNFS